ncbi:MAG: hypothetical protein LIO65_04855, partial [Odoribacter sp.]|nr:hypothetical protein [Odoribacter sp.]
PNLLNAVCLDDVNTGRMHKTFFLSQLYPVSTINYTPEADFFVGEQYKVNIKANDKIGKTRDKSILLMEDMIERGEGNTIPLWLTGFLY